MLSTRWSSLWLHLGARTVPDLAPVLTALAEPHRHYHTLAHVRHCLAVLDRGPRRDDVVELALWLHDARYDAHAKDNEERSAEWCQALAAEAGISGETAERAHACILATRHQHLPADEHEALTVSIDLAILGGTPTEFRRYDQQIRREYAWVPMSTYRRERARVLRGFLDRSVIYPHPWFERRLGDRARFNLRRALRAGLDVAMDRSSDMLPRSA